MKRSWFIVAGAVVLAIVLPGALVALGWKKRGAIMDAVGYVFRSAYSGNFGGARTAPVDQLVIHTTEGTAASAISWFSQDHRPWGAGPSSAHYVVGRDGTVTAMVPEDKVAWHASDRTANGRSIGIECEGYAANPETWTPELLAALVALSAQLVRKYGIPVKRGTPGIIAHADVPYAATVQGKTDPGPHFPWNTYLDRVRASSMGVA